MSDEPRKVVVCVMPVYTKEHCNVCFNKVGNMLHAYELPFDTLFASWLNSMEDF